jgi:hypothetical protein
MYGDVQPELTIMCDNAILDILSRTLVKVVCRLGFPRRTHKFCYLTHFSLSPATFEKIEKVTGHTYTAHD